MQAEDINSKGLVKGLLTNAVALVKASQIKMYFLVLEPGKWREHRVRRKNPTAQQVA